MAEFDLNNVSKEQFDLLKEIGNIGAGNATTALAQMLQCKVDMNVPQVRLLEFSEVGAVIGGEEQHMAGVYLDVEGDIKGSMMFLLEVDAAHALIAKLMGGMQTGTGSEFSEMGMSALGEIGNIIVGAYLNSLAMLTQFKIFPSPPATCVDMAGALLSVAAIQFGAIGDRILLIQSHFSDEMQLNGYFILIPDLESYNKILEALGAA